MEFGFNRNWNKSEKVVTNIIHQPLAKDDKERYRRMHAMQQREAAA